MSVEKTMLEAARAGYIVGYGKAILDWLGDKLITPEDPEFREKIEEKAEVWMREQEEKL